MWVVMCLTEPKIWKVSLVNQIWLEIEGVCVHKYKILQMAGYDKAAFRRLYKHVLDVFELYMKCHHEHECKEKEE